MKAVYGLCIIFVVVSFGSELASAQLQAGAVPTCVFFGCPVNTPIVPGTGVDFFVLATAQIDLGRSIPPGVGIPQPNGFAVSVSGQLGDSPAPPPVSGNNSCIREGGVIPANVFVTGFRTAYDAPGSYTVTFTIIRCVWVGFDQMAPEATIAAISATATVVPRGGGQQPSARLQVTDLDGNELSHFDIRQSNATAPRQTLKLGQEVRIFIFPLLADGTEGALLPASENVSDSNDQSPSDSQVFKNRTELFAGQVLVHFPTQDSLFHRLFPVHSGTANVHFTFQNQGKSFNVTLPVKVTNCSAGDCVGHLGSVHPEFDGLLMKFADRNGIPPQLLKAQIQQESGFRPNAYRYEPLSIDFAQIVAPARKGTTPFRVLAQKAFAPWALAESTDCTAAHIFSPQRGSLNLASADATARQIYSLSLDKSGTPLCREIGANQAQSFRHIQPADALPSMENVLFTNDSVLVDWFAQGFKGSSAIRFLDYQIANPPFTAQTVIAASYGLHQVLYQTAVGEGYTDSVGAGLAPGNLFQPSISLDLGTEYLAQKFEEAERKYGAQEQVDYQDATALLQQFGPALRGFNGVSPPFTVTQFRGSCGATPPIPLGQLSTNVVYACNAVRNAPTYNPQPIH